MNLKEVKAISVKAKTTQHAAPAAQPSYGDEDVHEMREFNKTLEKTGWTQEEAAEHLGVSQGLISMIHGEKRKPGKNLVWRLQRVLEEQGIKPGRSKAPEPTPLEKALDKLRRAAAKVPAGRQADAKEYVRTTITLLGRLKK